MAKQKISTKRGFSFENMSNVKLKKGMSLERHNPSKTLKNSHMVYEGLLQALKDGDADAFKEILAAYLNVVNKDQFSAKAKISKRTLFRMISEEGNPTLDNIARVVHALQAA